MSTVVSVNTVKQCAKLSPHLFKLHAQKEIAKKRGSALHRSHGQLCYDACRKMMSVRADCADKTKADHHPKALPTNADKRMYVDYRSGTPGKYKYCWRLNEPKKDEPNFFCFPDRSRCDALTYEVSDSASMIQHCDQMQEALALAIEKYGDAE